MIEELVKGALAEAALDHPTPDAATIVMEVDSRKRDAGHAPKKQEVRVPLPSGREVPEFRILFMAMTYFRHFPPKNRQIPPVLTVCKP